MYQHDNKYKHDKHISSDIDIINDRVSAVVWVTDLHRNIHRRRYNVDLILAQHLRRWASIKSTLFERLVFVWVF